MIYTLNIDNGVEVELEHDLKCMLHGSLICFEFRTPRKSVPYSFLLPNDYDELVPFLFDASLTKTIDHALRYTQTLKGGIYLSAYGFYIVDSVNHLTNITPEFISTISKFHDMLK